MTTKGSSMGFQVSTVDYVFVVPGFGGLGPRGTVFVYPRQISPFLRPTYQPLLYATYYYTTLIHDKPTSIASMRE